MNSPDQRRSEKSWDSRRGACVAQDVAGVEMANCSRSIEANQIAVVGVVLLVAGSAVDKDSCCGNMAVEASPDGKTKAFAGQKTNVSVVYQLAWVRNAHCYFDCSVEEEFGSAVWTDCRRGGMLELEAAVDMVVELRGS